LIGRIQPHKGFESLWGYNRKLLLNSLDALKELKKENEYFKKELEALKSWVMQAQKSK
jgi:hypothetical protein